MRISKNGASERVLLQASQSNYNLALFYASYALTPETCAMIRKACCRMGIEMEAL